MSTEIRSKGDHSRAPWNKSCLVGQKRPLRPKEVWAIRVRLQIKRRKRDLAMFNLAIDSRGCPLGAPEGRAMSMGARIVRWVVLTVFTAITLSRCFGYCCRRSRPMPSCSPARLAFRHTGRSTISSTPGMRTRSISTCATALVLLCFRR